MAILVVGHHEDSWKSTYLEVRLLMTPVVVLNCSARAKIVVMPIKKFHHIRLVEVKAQEPFIAPIPESKSGTIAASVMIAN